MIKESTILSIILSSILLSSQINANVIDRIENNYKSKKNPIEFFKIDTNETKFNENFIINNDKNIVILHDDFKEHGKNMLDLFENQLSQNLFLYDYSKKEIKKYGDGNETKIIMEFESFLYQISKLNPGKKITISMSNGFINTKKETMKEIFEYNINFISLLEKLNNIYLNKALGNIDSNLLRKDLGKLLNYNVEEINSFIEKIDSKFDEITFQKNTFKEKEIEIIKLIKENLNEKDIEPKKIYDFEISYYIYKMEIRKNSIDAFSIIAGLRHLNNNELSSRINIISGINIKSFKNNINIYKEKLPKELIDFSDSLPEKLELEKHQNLIKEFSNIYNKYINFYPEIFKNKYTIGMAEDKTKCIVVQFDGIYNKNEIHFGTSIATAIQTLIENIELKKENIELKKEIIKEKNNENNFIKNI